MTVQWGYLSNALKKLKAGPVRRSPIALGIMEKIDDAVNDFGSDQQMGEVVVILIQTDPEEPQRH